jgi:hypothetical protein
MQSLQLLNNRLTSLPKEIGQLSHLKALHLGLNRLESFPEDIEISNSIALSIAGFGAGLGQSQKIDKYLKSSDYKQFTQSSHATAICAGTMSVTNTNEYPEYGERTNKTELNVFSIGVKFLVGVELKIYSESQTKSR